MTHGLLPALADHADEIIPRLERALDQFGASQGF
jgi:hypothetical protein